MDTRIFSPLHSRKIYKERVPLLFKLFSDAGLPNGIKQWFDGTMPDFESEKFRGDSGCSFSKWRGY